jgi:hypothetical protein
MNFVDYILKMLAQPSSYAGIGVIAASIGMSAPAYQEITTAIAALAGLAAFFIDGGKIFNTAPKA